ncbi:MAG: tRNA (adenosine(37)-N6)-dimethylallyltransferase MiaA [Bacteroidales bacterium]
MHTLIVLLGPTGVGKTELSLSIAELFGADIISSDSRQLYADIPIGTAAATPQERSRVKHHFVGTLALSDYYSAAQFELDALGKLDELFAKNSVVVMTGGSMMYIDALCNGIDDLPTVDDQLRASLVDKFNSVGLDGICAELKLLDPVYYDQVDLKNHKRVLHALEICYMTGRPYSELRTNIKKVRPFRIIKIGLNRDRQELYDRINRRVDLMVEQGLLDEARRVEPFKHFNSLNTVGYKELFAYFDGDFTLEFALDKIRQNSRIYAKKQLTWFKRDKEIRWFHPDDKDEVISYLKEQI